MQKLCGVQGFILGQMRLAPSITSASPSHSIFIGSANTKAPPVFIHTSLVQYEFLFLLLNDSHEISQCCSFHFWYTFIFIGLKFEFFSDDFFVPYSCLG